MTIYDISYDEISNIIHEYLDENDDCADLAHDLIDQLDRMRIAANFHITDAREISRLRSIAYDR